MDKLPKDITSTKDTYYAALREKGRDLTQSYNKSSFTDRKSLNPFRLI